ncbi:MAG: MarR family transcriptional regulator [Actinomycetota bacterium]
MAERLHSAAIQLLRRVRVRDGEPGLSASRLSALSVIVATGPLTIGELAATQGVRSPTMTRVIDGLERDGLAMREPHPDDGRSVRVRATGMGRLALSRGRQYRVTELSAELTELGAEDLATLDRAAALLERIGHLS